MTRFTLEKGKWYGMTMYPGYSNIAYHSPIRIHGVHPSGSGLHRLDLHFFNAAYAPGVQDFTWNLTLLRREKGYMLASIRDSDRAIAITPFNLAWAHAHMGHSLNAFMEAFNDTGCEACAMNRLIGHGC